MVIYVELNEIVNMSKKSFTRIKCCARIILFANGIRKKGVFSGMLKKLSTIFTSIFLSLIMIMNMILPACAINENSEMGAQIKSGVYCIQSMVGKDSDNRDMFLDIRDFCKYDNAVMQLYPKHEYFGQAYANPGCLNQEFYLWYDPSDGCYTIIPMHTVFDGTNVHINFETTKCIGLEMYKGGSKREYHSVDCLLRIIVNGK